MDGEGSSEEPRRDREDAPSEAHDAAYPQWAMGAAALFAVLVPKLLLLETPLYSDEHAYLTAGDISLRGGESTYWLASAPYGIPVLHAYLANAWESALAPRWLSFAASLPTAWLVASTARLVSERSGTDAAPAGILGWLALVGLLPGLHLVGTHGWPDGVAVLLFFLGLRVGLEGATSPARRLAGSLLVCASAILSYKVLGLLPSVWCIFLAFDLPALRGEAVKTWLWRNGGWMALNGLVLVVALDLTAVLWTAADRSSWAGMGREGFGGVPFIARVVALAKHNAIPLALLAPAGLRWLRLSLDGQSLRVAREASLVLPWLSVVGYYLTTDHLESLHKFFAYANGVALAVLGASIFEPLRRIEPKARPLLAWAVAGVWLTVSAHQLVRATNQHNRFAERYAWNLVSLEAAAVTARAVEGDVAVVDRAWAEAQLHFWRRGLNAGRVFYDRLDRPQLAPFADLPVEVFLTFSDAQRQALAAHTETVFRNYMTGTTIALRPGASLGPEPRERLARLQALSGVPMYGRQPGETNQAFLARVDPELDPTVRDELLDLYGATTAVPFDRWPRPLETPWLLALLFLAAALWAPGWSSPPREGESSGGRATRG